MACLLSRRVSSRVLNSNLSLFMRINKKKNIQRICRKAIRSQRSSVVRWVSALKRSHIQALEDSVDSSPGSKEVTSASSELTVDPTKNVTSENQYEKLAEVVTPLWKIPYEKQLVMKYEKMRDLLKSLGHKLKEVNSPVKRNLEGLPCYLKLTVASPTITEYRNKDEFQLKHGIDGNPKTLGFLIGRPVKGTVCVNPDFLVNVKTSHLRIAKKFESYARGSLLPMCDKFDKGGYWRGFTVRSNLKGDLMGIVIMHPQRLTQEELQSEKAKLADYFSSKVDQTIPLKSLYFQACKKTRCSHEDAPYELIFGDPFIYEEIDNLKFRISPGSFFQINTQAASLLYQIIQNIAEVKDNTVLIDVCCGIGTITLFMARYVRTAIGIEFLKEAVNDAKINAKINDIKNAAFYTGKAEKVLPDLIKHIDCDNIVAIVNPSRAGLHNNVIAALRQCTKISKIIYISCKPEGFAKQNFINLCRKADQVFTGQPFIPKVAIPVDMFPQTDHCELIILFERFISKRSYF